MLDSPDGLWRPQTKTPTRTEQTRTQSRFFRTEPLTLNSCRSLDYARGNESIIYFTELCKPIETYIYARKKHPFASYPAAKHPNLRLQTYHKKQWTYLLTPHGRQLWLSQYFSKNLGSFAKVSVPGKIYIQFLALDLEHFRVVLSYRWSYLLS